MNPRVERVIQAAVGPEACKIFEALGLLEIVCGIDGLVDINIGEAEDYLLAMQELIRIARKAKGLEEELSRQNKKLEEIQAQAQDHPLHPRGDIMAVHVKEDTVQWIVPNGILPGKYSAVPEFVIRYENETQYTYKLVKNA